MGNFYRKPPSRFAKYSNRGFDPDQLMQIKHGINAGLSDEEIDVYAKKEISWGDMFEYRELLLKKNIPFKYIKKMSDEGFGDIQITNVTFGFCNKFTIEQIESYCSSKYKENRMSEIKMGFYLINKYIQDTQKYPDCHCYYNAYEFEDKYTKDQLEEISTAFIIDELTPEEVANFASNGFTAEEMRELRLDIVARKKTNKKSWILKRFMKNV